MINIIKLFIKYGLFPAIGLLFWLYFSFINNPSYSYLTLVDYYGINILGGNTKSNLIKGEKLTGQFLSKYENLGIVGLRFFNFERISDDKVIFRIKDKNKPIWFYQNTYKVDQFQPDGIFTFGFNTIKESKNKIFQFEVESVQGEPDNSIALSKVYPQVASMHKFDRTEVFSSPGMFGYFIIHKFVNAYKDLNFAMMSILYSQPLILYLLWIFYFEKRNAQLINISKETTVNIIIRLISIYTSFEGGIKPIHILTFYISLMLFTGFFIREFNTLAQIIIVTIWITIVRIFNYDYRLSFTIALVFILMGPLLLLGNMQPAASNMAMIGYYLLGIGTIQAFINFRKTPN